MRTAALVVAGALLMGAGGQEPPGRTQAPAQPPVPLKPGTAVIVGKVVEAGGTTPVPGAQVILGGAALGASSAIFRNGVAGGTRSAEADGQGQFVFRDLPVGEYRLTVTASGFLNGAYGDRRPLQTRRQLDASPTLELIDADRLVNVTLSMWRLGGISGRVIDEAGEPVVGAPISIVPRPSASLATQPEPLATVMTDDRGLYHADVGPAEYFVALLAATTTVPASAVDGFVQAQREGGATFNAYMRDVSANGALLPRGVGARIDRFLVSQFGSRNAWVVRPPSTSGDGVMFYPTAFHPAGTRSSSASTVRVASGEELSGIDIQLRPMPSRRLSGRITGAAGAAAGLTLFLIPAESAARTASASVLNSLETLRAMTDGNGDFTFLGVTPGAYALAGARKLAPNTPSESVEWFTESVSVADRDVIDLAIGLQPGGQITGRLVVEGSGAAFPAAALRTIAVGKTPIPGSVGAWTSFGAGSVRLDESSRFALRGVAPGRYVLLLDQVPAGWMLKAVTSGGRDVFDRPIEVTGAGVSIDDVVVTVTDRIPTLAGAIRHDDGRAASDARVIVFPADKSLWQFPEFSMRRVRTAAPSRDGRYLIRGLPPGEYLVAAVGSPDVDFADEQTLTKVSRLAVPLTIGDGDNKAVDLRVMLIK